MKYKIRFNSPLWWAGQAAVMLVGFALLVVGLAVIA